MAILIHLINFSGRVSSISFFNNGIRFLINFKIPLLFKPFEDNFSDE